MAAVRVDRTDRRQLIHGDLTGNVLFDEDRPPLVIDLSPYWRPTGFAAAIVVADALVLGLGPRDVVEAAVTSLHVDDLVRALVFRIVADHLLARDHRQSDDPYRDAVALALRLALWMSDAIGEDRRI